MDLSNLPLAYFPLVNIALVWMGVPLSAWICRRNPVIGLAPYGFILVNGLMHCLGTLSGMMPLSLNPGFWTGIDWATRKLVGHELSPTLEVAPVVACFRRAVAEHGAPGIANSDQGSQFTSDEYYYGAKPKVA